jgi:matrix metalloproteinase-15 (membrane-inserted)
LFSTDRFWKYSAKTQMEPFYPRVMVRWHGIPENLDAAISIINGPTIFFKGSEYWIFDDRKVRPKKNYPKKVEHLFDDQCG